MNDTSAQSNSRPSAPPAVRSGNGLRRFAWGMLALSLVLAIVAVVQGLVLESHLRQVQFTQASQEARAAERDQRLATLEHGQTANPDATSSDPARREALALADLQTLIDECQSRLRMGTDPARVLDTLLVAQKHTTLLSPSVATRVQAALQADIARLRRAPDLNRVATVARLDDLLAEVDHWHALADPTHAARGPVAAEAPGHQGPEAALGVNSSWGERLRAWMAAQFGDLVRVQVVGNAPVVPLAPVQQAVLKDRIRIQLLSLRQGVLLRDRVIVRTESAALNQLIGQSFDSADPAVAAAVTSLHAIGEGAQGTDPSLDDTLAALRSVVHP
jgi:uncharacterized protein HemX